MTTEERFWAKVALLGDGGCWLWTGSTHRQGYGMVRVDGRTVYAHRWAYEHLVGPIPEGLSIDHLCRVPACVNPTHLEPCTQRTNVLRGEAPTAVNAVKTHCPRGHELTEGNLVPSVLSRGSRNCLTCNREQAAMIKSACESLGMTQRAYGAEYGWSTATARAIVGAS